MTNIILNLYQYTIYLNNTKIILLMYQYIRIPPNANYLELIVVNSLQVDTLIYVIILSYVFSPFLCQMRFLNQIFIILPSNP